MINTDKTQYNARVMEFQHMLRLLAYWGYDITPVVPDGIFDEKTRAAVKELQRELGLEQTGTVDRATWMGCLEMYKRELAKKRPCVGIYPFTNGDEIKAGDSGDVVIYIQTMLKELSHVFKNCDGCEINGTFDEKTVQAVKAFQEYSLIPQTGTVDISTWDLLAKHTPCVI